MAISLYDSRALTSAVNKIIPPNTQLLDLFNMKIEPHASDIIDWEIISESKSIAQFVSPDATEAKKIKKRTREVKSIKIPRTWEELIFSAQKLKDISAIGNMYNTSSKEKDNLINQRVLEEVEYLKNRVIRLRTQMFAEQLNTGQLVINQDDYQATITTGMISDTLANGGHIVDLSSDVDWSSATGNIDSQIQKIKQAFAKRGKTARVCVLGSDASLAFQANEKVRKILDNNNIQSGRLNLNSPQESTLIPIGTFLGVNFYEYSDTYENAAGVITPMIGVKKAIFADTASEFKMHTAPVYRIEGNSFSSIQAEFYLDSRVERKQTLTWELEQKALPQIKDPDAILSAQVIAS